MNNLYLSCGHAVNSMSKSFNVITKAIDREGKKALTFSTVCSSCKKSYMQSSDLFDSEEDAMNWLTSSKK